MSDGLIIDNFAGGGGASLALEEVCGRVDIAINHDAKAIAMHRANHPDTRHICENVFAVDPVRLCDGRPVAVAHFSPDCTHHSRAKGGKPVKKNIRGLAWIVIRWARTVRPAIITLENVPEFEDWGPLTREGRPCPDRKGQTFAFFVGKLRRYGYRVEWRRIRFCDYGDPTIRERIFLVARADGVPIRWPAPTHGPGLKPHRTAASHCIDWSIPCPSIFERKRPLAEKTQARIARGIWKFVLTAARPFIAPVTHHGDRRVHSIDEPLRTVTCAKRGELALVAPHVSRQFGRGTGAGAYRPLPTVTGGGSGKSALVTAWLVKHFGGVTGVPIDTPMPTTTTRGTQTQLVTSNLIKFKGTCRHGQPVTEPMPAVQAGGQHVGEVRAFLMKYYGTGGQYAACADPMHTLTAKARMGLVTVEGQEYQIGDIGMRMLTPRELFRAHSFPDDYIIDPLFEGRSLTKTDQIAKVGNSVPRRGFAALLRANLGVAADAAEVA